MVPRARPTNPPRTPTRKDTAESRTTCHQGSALTNSSGIRNQPRAAKVIQGNKSSNGKSRIDGFSGEGYYD